MTEAMSSQKYNNYNISQNLNWNKLQQLIIKMRINFLVQQDIFKWTICQFSVEMTSGSGCESHLASDVLVDQMVLSFVVEDDMNFLCAGAAYVRT